MNLGSQYSYHYLVIYTPKQPELEPRKPYFYITIYHVNMEVFTQSAQTYVCSSKVSLLKNPCSVQVLSTSGSPGVGSHVWHETSKEGRRTYWLKCFEYNNKDVVNSPNILRNNYYQASSQKFRQIKSIGHNLS